MNNRYVALGSAEKIRVIKNEVRCRDDTVPKTGDTRRHCEVELTVCNNLPQPPSLVYISFFGGCGRLLHTVNSTSQCLLVSPVFGTVSSLHPTSLLVRSSANLPARVKCNARARLCVI